MDKGSSIYVAGHRGLVGSALVRALEDRGYANLVTRSHDELDLLDQGAVKGFFGDNAIDYVLVAAARVGGIVFNLRFPADQLYENTMIAANVIHAAAHADVTKLLFLGSSCIYPRLANQPMTEDQLLTGPLEPTNEAYALAKIVGLKLCETYNRQYKKRFISAMPTNLYGPGDNFHPEYSHVIPGQMRRFHEAKKSSAASVEVWGTGKPRREFLHVDDLADALLVLMEKYEEPTTINVGTGSDVTIAEVAARIRSAVGFEGEVTFDTSKPDGMPRKLLDISRIQELGWAPKVDLETGLSQTYEWALSSGVFDA